MAGVLNGALLTAEELGKFVDAWNGRPVPILHPEDHGEPVSANRPDILERVVGTVFNAALDGDRLRAELWLDDQRFDALGFSALLASMKNGETVEVSTGYFADTLVKAGEFKGKPYTVAHVNLRPDHLALLPGQVGACSIADGCGAPRVNSSVKAKLSEAFDTIREALGIKSNCQCEEQTMKAADIVALAERLRANGLQVNFDVAELEKMSDAGRAAVMGALRALEKAASAAAGKANEDDEETPPSGNEDDEEAEAMKRNAALPKTAAELATFITNTVTQAVAKAVPAQIAEAQRRANVQAALLANSANVLTVEDMAAMPVEVLEKIEKSIRPADYSGAGGAPMVANTGEPVRPFINRGLLFAPKDGAQ